MWRLLFIGIIMFRKRRYKKKSTKLVESKLVESKLVESKLVIGEKAHEIIYVFDKFGKPIIKSWKPNPIRKFDDFGDINYNTIT